MKKNVCIIALLISSFMIAQENLPYYEIPEHADNYTAGTVASRMIDGLGFRYYWATEGLHQKNLDYKASESGRSSEETVDHILGLSYFILNSTLEKGVKKDESKVSFKEKREQTLINIKKASDNLRRSKDISKYDNKKFPFWNIINGPIADALWHCGQIVMLRRASGNPFSSKVNVFTGTLRE